MLGRISALVILLISLFSIGGAFATWRYSGTGPLDQSVDMSVVLNTFDYPPEQILPGGDTEEAPLGENHLALTQLILYENDKGYGLNINDNVLIHQYLRSNEVVYSNQKISGGNLKFILDPSNNTHGLYYCIQKVSNSLYYSYTFDINHLSTAGGTDIEIPVYRTSLEKISGEWKATVSYAGAAKTIRLSEVGLQADPKALIYSIDVYGWHI